MGTSVFLKVHGPFVFHATIHYRHTAAIVESCTLFKSCSSLSFYTLFFGAFYQQRNQSVISVELSLLRGRRLQFTFFSSSEHADLSFIWAEKHLFTCFFGTNSHIFAPSEVIISSMILAIQHWGFYCVLSTINTSAFYLFFFSTLDFYKLIH